MNCLLENSATLSLQFRLWIASLFALLIPRNDKIRKIQGMLDYRLPRLLRSLAMTRQLAFK